MLASQMSITLAWLAVSSHEGLRLGFLEAPSGLAIEQTVYRLTMATRRYCSLRQPSGLTQLEFLEFHVLPSRALVRIGPVDLNWFTHIKLLTHLALRVGHACTFLAGLPSVANLGELKLLPPIEVGAAADTLCECCWDWAHGFCFRTLFIGYRVLPCEYSLLRLATVKFLSQVSICCLSESLWFHSLSHGAVTLLQSASPTCKAHLSWQKRWRHSCQSNAQHIANKE